MAEVLFMPRILEQQGPESDQCQLRLAIDAQLFWFRGHFPAAPILPGVVQINWARQLAASLWPDCAWLNDLANMEAVKFQQLLVPGDAVTLALNLDRPRRKLSFAYSEGERRFSSGRLVVLP